MNTFYVGQRVFIPSQETGEKEIGTVVFGPRTPEFGTWVYSPSRKYEVDFALENVEPLPNGQL